MKKDEEIINEALKLLSKYDDLQSHEWIENIRPFLSKKYDKDEQYLDKLVYPEFY